MIGPSPRDALVLPRLAGGVTEAAVAAWPVNHRAIGVVDEAMTPSGGSGCAAPRPLARLYRHLRSGPFMQLFSPGEAFEYMARVAFGVPMGAG